MHWMSMAFKYLVEGTTTIYYRNYLLKILIDKEIPSLVLYPQYEGYI